ncbi:MAG TPA: D-aminoacyl-tRNA deacylase [Synergistaceae bacterium]|nr:D-aminoacyl-tRNA deacylase [Synergistaceae bacterium]
MRSVVQRVSWARVSVEGQEVGSVGKGLCVLVGVTHEDGPKDVEWMADKLIHLRIFEDEAGKMNKSLMDVGGAMMLVSQFTLLGDCRRGRRPSFLGAALPEKAREVYDGLIAAVRSRGVSVASGVFQAEMAVELCNAGPVTLILDSRGEA